MVEVISAEWVISVEVVTSVEWEVGVTVDSEATRAGTVCRSTEVSALVGRSWPEWVWAWGWDLDMEHLATPMAAMDTVTRTADMGPRSVVMATGVTVTPATEWVRLSTGTNAGMRLGKVLFDVES